MNTKNELQPFVFFNANSGSWAMSHYNILLSMFFNGLSHKSQIVDT